MESSIGVPPVLVVKFTAETAVPLSRSPRKPHIRHNARSLDIEVKTVTLCFLETTKDLAQHSRNQFFAHESPRILRFSFFLHVVESLITKNLKRRVPC